MRRFDEPRTLGTGVVTFIPDTMEIEAGTEEDAGWFLFRKAQVLVGTGRASGLPIAGGLSSLLPRVVEPTPIGTLDGRRVMAGDCPADAPLPDGFAFQDLRQVYTHLPAPAASAAGYGFQILRWKRTSRFCGGCGHRLQDSPQERSRFCPSCGGTSYPPVYPAVIVAVTRGEEILLARAHRFRPSIFSVLAGYVEPGESLEECVRREVREEVGIELDAVDYFGSQSWPFSSALMVAFTARYAGGKVRADGREIAEAGWYRHDRLPPVPGPPSIARKLIEAFVGRYGGRVP